MNMFKVSGLTDDDGNQFTAYVNLDEVRDILIEGDKVEITLKDATRYTLGEIDVKKFTEIMDKLLGINLWNHYIKDEEKD